MEYRDKPIPAGPLAMYWLKMCPRCRGDLHVQEDRFGRYVACLQCGRPLSGAQAPALGVVTTASDPSRRSNIKSA